MELAFPQTINMRLAANQKIIDASTSSKPRHEKDFVYSGTFDSVKAKEMENKFISMKTTAAINLDKVAEKKIEQDKSDELFAQKFGILKKASVLLQFNRPIDAFDEVSKAANIIKD